MARSKQLVGFLAMYGTPKKQQQQINRDQAVGHQMLYDLMLQKADNDVLKGETTGDWTGGDLFSNISSAVTLGGRFK